MEEIRIRIENLLQQINSYRKETRDKIKLISKEIQKYEQEIGDIQNEIDKLEGYQEKVPEDEANNIEKQISELEAQKRKLQRVLRNLCANRYKTSMPILAGQLKQEVVVFFQTRGNIVSELNEMEKRLISKWSSAEKDSKREVEEKVKECKRLRKEIEKLDIEELAQIDITAGNEVGKTETVIQDVREQLLGEDEEVKEEKENLRHRLRLGVPSYQQQAIESKYRQQHMNTGKNHEKPEKPLTR